MSSRPKCDCLNFCGDDPWLDKGKAEYCDDYKATVKAQALIESVHWRLPADEVPESGKVVLGFFDDVDENPVWPCFLHDGKWMIEDCFPTKAPNAWSPMPCGPSNTPWMKVRKA